MNLYREIIYNYMKHNFAMNLVIKWYYLKAYNDCNILISKTE